MSANVPEVEERLHEAERTLAVVAILADWQAENKDHPLLTDEIFGYAWNKAVELAAGAFYGLRAVHSALPASAQARPAPILADDDGGVR